MTKSLWEMFLADKKLLFAAVKTLPKLRSGPSLTVKFLARRLGEMEFLMGEKPVVFDMSFDDSLAVKLPDAKKDSGFALIVTRPQTLVASDPKRTRGGVESDKR